MRSNTKDNLEKEKTVRKKKHKKEKGGTQINGWREKKKEKVE